MSKFSKILIVDDDPDDQEILAELMCKADDLIACSFADNGILGLQMLETQPLPDIIFVDLNMPKMNGKEFLIAKAFKPAIKNIPAIVLSTSNLDFDKETCLENGAAEFWVKPNNFAVLRQRIELLGASN